MSIPVPAAYARALLRQFGKSPAERAELLAGTGLDEGALAAPGSDTTVHALLALVANITRLRGETWPFEAATIWSTAMQGALDVAIRSAATIDEALATAARYGRVRAPYMAIRLVASRRTRRLVFEQAFAGSQSEWRAIALAVALSTQSLFAQLLEDSVVDAAMEFPWPAPPHADRLRAAFSCSVRFSAPALAFEVPATACAAASPFADATLHARALAELDEAARRLGGEDIAGAIERLIAQHLPRRLGEQGAATRLGLSRRTLVRRLSDSGAPFRSIVDNVLRDKARAMIAAGRMSRDDMAAALGYSDPTSFSRACRRWFPKA